MTKKSPIYYYDIESLENVFSLALFKPNENKKFDGEIDLYILCDNNSLLCVPKFPKTGPKTFYNEGKTLLNQRDFYIALTKRIYEKNRNFRGNIRLFDLHKLENILHMAKVFGLSDADIVNNPKSKSSFPAEFRPVCDTDPEYKEHPEKYPYLAGYNSLNYDTTVLAEYLHTVLNVRHQAANRKDITINETPNNAAYVRKNINDMLFSAAFKNRMPNFLLYDKETGGNDYNNRAYKIRKNMVLSGRQLDVAALTKQVTPIALKRLLGQLGFQILESGNLTGSKSLLQTPDEFLDLLAYNVSDIVNLRELFLTDMYQAEFTLKKQLLQTYPELIYKEKDNTYKPDITPYAVRKDRLYINSTSSKFAQLSLSPYHHLDDIETVSYNYPDQKMIDKIEEENKKLPADQQIHIKQVNVLEEAKKFFYNLYDDPAIRAEFDKIYNYYKSIEGKNFNTTKHYMETYPNGPEPVKLEDIPKGPTFLHYYDKNGNTTSCYANFSVGGVHGAEYNKEAYDYDLMKWQSEKNDIEYVRSKWPDPKDLKLTFGTKPKTVILPDGTVLSAKTFNNHVKEYSDLSEKERNILIELSDTYLSLTETAESIKNRLKTATDNQDEEGKKEIKKEQTLHNKTIREFSEQYPILKNYTPAKRQTFALIAKNFGQNLEKAQSYTEIKPTVTMPDGREIHYENFVTNGKSLKNIAYKDVDSNYPTLVSNDKVKKEYTFTSSSLCNHEDFTSYYPNLLRMMNAFFNTGLNYDRYAEIFQQKQDYGVYMKDKNRPEAEREIYRILREGTKLILNAASGAANAKFDNNILMSNNIISMRIIGQLFSWRIGQAQAYYGAKIISTNTDGLYSVMDEELNNKILAEEAKNINVEIEPEPVFLISKDSNTRVEITPDFKKVIGASGGSLSCRKGPRTDKSLNHPAIIDWALCEYLMETAKPDNDLSLDKPFDENMGWKILARACDMKTFDFHQWMLMFQNIIASSPGTHQYIYAKHPNTYTEPGADMPIPLQHYNRIFYMQDFTENTYHIHKAKFDKIRADTQKKREKNNEPPFLRNDKQANLVLEANGENLEDCTYDAKTIKVTNIEPSWFIYIQNKDLRFLSNEEKDFIWSHIDLSKYLGLIKNAFENNWRNIYPNHRYITFKILGKSIQTVDYKIGETPEFPVLEPTQFIGWNTSPDGQGEFITKDNLPETHDTVLYAVSRK